MQACEGLTPGRMHPQSPEPGPDGDVADPSDSSATDRTPDTRFAFAEEVRGFLGDVSVVGARYVALNDAPRIRKVVWITLILFGIGFLAFQIFDRVKYFSSNPIMVDVRLFHNRTLRFPTVTICNENRLSKRRVAVMGDDVVDYIVSLNPAIKFADQQPVNVNHGMFNFSAINWAQFYAVNAQPKEEALVVVSWDGRDIYASALHNVETNMGHCFQFNSAGDNYVSSQAGATYGLKLILFLNQSDYLITNEGSLVAGFRVALHTPDEVPLMKEWGFRVTPGFQTLVAVSMTKVTDWGPPYVECEKNESYSQSRCLAQCKADFVVDRCQCRAIGMLKEAPVCEPPAMYECVSEAQTLYVAADHQSTCPCPRSCTDLTYKFTLSAAVAADHVIALMGMGGVFESPEVAKQSVPRDFAMVEIFFSQLSYEEVATRPAYTILALFCDIGGATGLILGSSILTLFEVIDFVFVVTWRARGRGSGGVVG